MNEKAKEETSKYLEKLSARKGRKITLVDLQQKTVEVEEEELADELVSGDEHPEEDNSGQEHVQPQYDKVEEEILVRLDEVELNPGDRDEDNDDDGDIPVDLLKQVILQIK